MSTQAGSSAAPQRPARPRAPAPGEASTRTEKTEQSYLSRALWFAEHTSRHLSIADPSPLEVAAYALERREEWAKSTWRQMKAALMYRYSEMQTAESLQAVEILREGVQTMCVVNTDRTSARRAKSVTPKALDAVISRTRASKSKYASLLETWLLLGAEIGLRPHEWGQAQLIHASPHELGDVDAQPEPGALVVDGALLPYLRIRNAKATNGRSHGEYRHLNLSSLKPDLVEMVGEFSMLMTEVVSSGSYALYYSACQKLLWRINSAIHGKSKNSQKWVQLYSPRHKFSSDAKKNLESGGVAALMGHATTKTASEHYGRRAHSTGSLGPKPVAAEIIRVRKVRGYKARNAAPAAIPSVTVEVSGG